MPQLQWYQGKPGANNEGYYIELESGFDIQAAYELARMMGFSVDEIRVGPIKNWNNTYEIYIRIEARSRSLMGDNREDRGLLR